MDKTKKPNKGLKDIHAEADAERLQAHLKLIDDLAFDANKAGPRSTDPPSDSDDAATD
ncbi:hypothetical protein [Bradyrhizobium sp. 1]|uniref:hypothetical protein n=1 Tax=Bradyrhizobium sp. 1 TaxID=241591 RepID=UPI001FF8BA26|nr:hypothetical protein [Bradyrhizobium sp. 1]MCK1396017.1 hypothetical protein [Bradyrhizobium sp. 1]